jgi:hypothetical protein
MLRAMVRHFLGLALAVAVCTLPESAALTFVSAGQADRPGAISAQPPSGYPPYDFERLPGWLAFATVPHFDAGLYYWSPVSTSQHVALFPEDDRSWTTVPAGQRFIGVAAPGTVPLVFGGVATLKYGCDGRTTDLAVFSSPPVPEGPVWLLPAGTTAGVASIPITGGLGVGVPAVGVWDHVPPAIRSAARTASASRAYIAGRATLVQYSTGRTTVRLVVVIDGRVAFEGVDEKYYMQGAPADGVDLDPRGIRDIGIPQPIGAFRFGTEWPMAIVLWVRAYEGNRFDVLRLDAAGIRRIKGRYVYYCAF